MLLAVFRKCTQRSESWRYEHSIQCRRNDATKI